MHFWLLHYQARRWVQGCAGPGKRVNGFRNGVGFRLPRRRFLAVTW